MISTNQMTYFKRSAIFFKMTEVGLIFCYVFMSPRACSLLRSNGQSFRNTFSRIKVTIWIALNTVSNGELSDPLCDSKNRALTLVGIFHSNKDVIIPEGELVPKFIPILGTFSNLKKHKIVLLSCILDINIKNYWCKH